MVAYTQFLCVWGTQSVPLPMTSERHHRECGFQEGETRALLPMKEAGFGCDQTITFTLPQVLSCLMVYKALVLLSPLICATPQEGDEPGGAHLVLT